MKNIALIPMRGGSKSIPHKNVREIAGKPLCFWVIDAALESELFDKIYISTDADYISNIVTSLFSQEIELQKIVIEKRPDHLAQDHTSTEEVIMHFIKDKTADNFCLIQATSPLLMSRDLRAGFEKLLSGEYDSVLSTCRIKRFFWSEEGLPQNYDYRNRPRRQDFKGYLVENGAFYFSTFENLLLRKNRLGGKIGIVEMHEDTFFEIDEPIDFEIVDSLLRKHKKKNPQIKAVVIDVDGTLTDGGMYYAESGEVLKKFNTIDAQGIALIRKLGIKVFILTAEDSPSVHARFKKVIVDHYSYGIKDKRKELITWAESNSISLNDILYIGDDFGDLEAMKLCGTSACPSNAINAIKKISHFISKRGGGEGAVRDVVDNLILNP